MSNITLKTLAKSTGYSVTTVSRALKNAPEINNNTKEKVIKIASLLNYQPNLDAYRLKMGKTFQICFFLNQHKQEDVSNYAKHIISGICNYLKNTEYELIVKPIFRYDDIEAVKEVVERKLADGIILTHTSLNDERVKYLSEKNFPFVTHGQTELFLQHPYYDVDNIGFIKKSLIYLKSKKIDEVIFVEPSKKFTYYNLSKKSFIDNAKKLKLKINNKTNLSLEDSNQTFQNKIFKVFNNNKNIKGIICGSDIKSLILLSTLVYLGYKVNKDVHIISKGIYSMPKYFYPKIPFFFEDMVEAGSKLGEFLLKRINGEKVNKLQMIDKIRYFDQEINK
ncbi:LacI family DNA-binding transcriptional regulator [Pelagibacteraceae bacterium]|nr:LacI family DNA-binding transcriptional regulator [Pelagibacteraceae bacterium]